MKCTKLAILAATLAANTIPLQAAEQQSSAEIEVTAAGPLGPLAGSFVNGGKGAPVMLILPGSGPTDRNGDNPFAGKPASYRMLAQALAVMGVSTLRVDKRGMFGSAKAVADANNVTVSDYVSDTRAWMDVAMKQSGTSCVWLAGHSEGGLIALATAQDPAKICGVILLAAPGRNLADVILEQLRANPANAIVLPDAEKVIALLRSGKTSDVSAMHPSLQGLFAPAVQGFLIDIFAHEPAILAGKINAPMLIVQGGRDLQVMASDAQALAKAQPKAKLLNFATMTHTLKHAENESPAASLATYTSPDLPVMPELVDAIAGFILGSQRP